MGFVPTATVVPVPLARLMRASVLQPNRLTAAMFCFGSIATPDGCGAAEQVGLLTSMLCSTRKSSAFVTFPLASATSSANRRADESMAGGTMAVNWRSLVPAQKVCSGVPSSRTVRFVALLVHVSPLPRTVSVCAAGCGACVERGVRHENFWTCLRHGEGLNRAERNDGSAVVYLVGDHSDVAAGIDSDGDRTRPGCIQIAAVQTRGSRGIDHGQRIVKRIHCDRGVRQRNCMRRRVGPNTSFACRSSSMSASLTD